MKNPLSGGARQGPGWFGPFGGAFVPETLIEPLRELEAAYAAARRDPNFKAELKRELSTFVGRPTPLTFAGRLSAALGLNPGELRTLAANSFEASFASATQTRADQDRLKAHCESFGVN